MPQVPSKEIPFSLVAILMLNSASNEKTHTSLVFLGLFIVSIGKRYNECLTHGEYST